MKDFILKVIFFVILFLILFFSSFLILSIIDNLKTHSTNNDILIVGDSHAVFSINENDALFSKQKIINNGYEAESLFWTIKRTKKILSKYKVNLVVVTYSDHNLFNDKWTYVVNSLSEKRDLIYFLSLKDWYYLLRRSKNQTFKGFFSLPLPSSKVTKNSKLSYDNLLSKDINTKGTRIKSHYQKNLNSIFKSENFRQLNTFCKENSDQKILIIRTPLNSNYFKLLGNGNYDKMYLESIQELKKFKNVNYIDFSNTIKEDSFFVDLDHLNASGTNKFTKIFYDSIKIKYDTFIK
jgi:hypothetical protein